MELIPLKSRRLKPGCDLAAELKQILKRARLTFKEGDILIVASKAVSYAENRLVPAEDFEKLRKAEAEQIFGRGPMVMTLKNKMLIPNAGIDFSNVPKGKMILWPRDPFASARRLRLAFGLKRFGVLIVDSGLHPLRRGTSGVAIGWAGFEGVEDLRGTRDLFDKKMKYSQVSVADNLASAGELVMGSSDASVPFVIARGVKVKFTNRKFSARDYSINAKKCLYHGCSFS
ncbi:MAG: coenzyme F420-0:L-glutamate ligase [Candidatus Peregrinibacteria bacterium]